MVIIVLFGIGVGLFFELKLLRLMRVYVVEYLPDEDVRFLLKLESLLFSLLSLLFVLLLLDLDSCPVFLPISFEVELCFESFLFFFS